MAESTTITLPKQVKNRLDRAHHDLHITEGIPRWQTVEQALRSLADDENIDLQPADDSADDESGRRRVRAGRSR